MLRRPRFDAGRDRARARQLDRRHQAGEGAARAASRCACCRRCCTAPAIRTRSRSPAAAPRPSIAALTRDDLVAFHRDWLRPDSATLIVVGDTTLAEIVPLLEKHFGDWKARRRGAGSRRRSPAVAAADASRACS